MTTIEEPPGRRRAGRRWEGTKAGTLVLVAAGLVGTGLLAGAVRPQEPVAAVEAVEAVVGKAAAGHETLTKKREHCSLPAGLLEELGIEQGQQVRIVSGDEVALYTVIEARDEGGEPIVRMGATGRRRLGELSEGAGVTVTTATIRSDLDDEEARALGDCVERLDDDGTQTGLIVLAPHGGLIEVQTDKQAARVKERLAGKPVSVWQFKGFGVRGGIGASARWHITSTEIHEESFPLLGRLADREYAHALSFHGMSREGVLIGGGAPMPLKVAIRDALRGVLDDSKIPIDIAMPGNPIGGYSPRNVVNRYCPTGGIQIEQGPIARREHWEAIADAVAEVYASRL